MQQPLTAARLRSVLAYDPTTGQFAWLVSRRCVPAGSTAGSIHKGKGYAFIRIDLKLYGAHRLAWLYVNGCWPKHEIDHINGDRADNRIANLRDVSHSVNMQNRPTARGCTQRKHGWEARIVSDGKAMYLGCYNSQAGASAAYRAARQAAQNARI